MTTEKVEALLRRGVVVPCPESIEVGDEVRPERIAPGVVIHTGCRLLGASTSIGPDSEVGAEAPATIDDCQLGRDVALKGGYFSGATFLDGASMGSGAHVRSGTLLEEEASGAHAVGLKQTIFLSYVTAGSLINFCDAFMAGGTSRRRHSEIGSSYIHFNFTPHGDKATPSLVGDVPSGVMLDRPPIFLGGQGGLVGPLRIAFGTVVPAGVICRRDVLEEGTVHAERPAAAVSRPFRPGAYRSIARVVANNLIYIGNIRALERWYETVRRGSTPADPYSAACHAGALGRLAAMFDERVRRLGELASRMPESIDLAVGDPELALLPAIAAEQRAFADRWPALEGRLREGPSADTGAEHRDRFLDDWERAGTGTHTERIAALPSEAKAAGTAWLQAVVDSVAGLGNG